MNDATRPDPSPPRFQLSWLAILSAVGGMIGFGYDSRADFVALIAGFTLAAVFLGLGILLDIRDRL